jgi:hypothetical protein
MLFQIKNSIVYLRPRLPSMDRIFLLHPLQHTHLFLAAQKDVLILTPNGAKVLSLVQEHSVKSSVAFIGRFKHKV